MLNPNFYCNNLSGKASSWPLLMSCLPPRTHPFSQVPRCKLCLRLPSLLYQPADDHPSKFSDERLSSQAAWGWLHPTVVAIRWEEGKQEGQVPTLEEGAGDRISCSDSDPAGSRNVGLENVTLNSGPSPNSFLLGGLIPGEHPFLLQYHRVLGQKGAGNKP